MLFLLCAGAYAYQIKADAVSIGLLNESSALFPDQTIAFLMDAEHTLERCLGRNIRVLAPLSGFRKADVIALAKAKGIKGTYSCHAGGPEPCGACIACNEFKFEGA